MSISIGNAPCSWGVEFADAPSNPPWPVVLDETSRAGYSGTELGPIGYMPEDVSMLRDSLDKHSLTLTAGVVFRPFHDGNAWDGLHDALRRTCRILEALGARHIVFIDSVSPARSACAGDSPAAPRLDTAQLAALHERLRVAARIARDEYGLEAALHAHAGGYIEFADELDHALCEIDEDLLGVCLDTGHSLYAGIDPVALVRRYPGRIRYVHLKDLNRSILQDAVRDRIGFYEACARGVFCNLGRGVVDFEAFRTALGEIRYNGWATVEQDRGPLNLQSSYDDARANFEFLVSTGMAG